MKSFGERLRTLRQQAGLSQNELAKQLKISKSSINMYERNEREPGFEIMESIADFFNVDMDYLYGRTDEPNRLKRLIDTFFTENGKITMDELQLALILLRGNINTDQYSCLDDPASRVRFSEVARAQQFLSEYLSLSEADQRDVYKYLQFTIQQNKKNSKSDDSEQ